MYLLHLNAAEPGDRAEHRKFHKQFMVLQAEIGPIILPQNHERIKFAGWDVLHDTTASHGDRRDM